MQYLITLIGFFFAFSPAFGYTAANTQNNNPECIHLRNITLQPTAEDTATSGNISPEMVALQRLIDSIDAGVQAVKNYFNHSDYSVLYDYLDDPKHKALKAALQSGKYTVIYLPFNAYHPKMSTDHYYTFTGPVDSMKIIYNENGIIENVVGYKYKGLYNIATLMEE